MYDSNNPNIATLNKVYQNSRTAIEAIDCLIPKVKDTGLKQAMASQILGHHNLLKCSAAKLHEVHHYPIEPNLLNAAASMRFKSVIDSSDGHIAEMLIENSTSSMIDIQRNLNQHSHLTQEVSNIGGEAVSFEQTNINKMRAYL